MIFKTRGTCATDIEFEIKDGIVESVRFINGCSGNTQGISKLVAGMQVSEVINKLEGIKCGRRDTSCPDQLATALKMSLRGES